MRRAPIVVVLVWIGAIPAFAQGTFPPSSFKNLQVFPKDATVAAVVGTMKGFTNALGVRCQFCRVGKEGLPLEQFDFVSDDIPQKKTARDDALAMDINKQFDAAVPHTAGSEARWSRRHRRVATTTRRHHDARENRERAVISA